MTPAVECGRALSRIRVVESAGSAGRPSRVPGNRCHEAQPSNERPRESVGGGFGGGPVHRCAVEHRANKFIRAAARYVPYRDRLGDRSTDRLSKTCRARMSDSPLDLSLLGSRGRRSICRIRRSSARFAAFRAASGLGFPSTSASSS